MSDITIPAVYPFVRVNVNRRYRIGCATNGVSSNIGLLKRGYVQQMRREIDEHTLERADILMTNMWGQEELDKTVVFWEASLDRPNLARKIVDAGQVLRA